MSKLTSLIIVGINFSPEPTGNAPYTTDLAISLSATRPVKVITGIPHYPWWSKQAIFDDNPLLNRHPNLLIRRINHFVPNKPSNFGRLLMELSFGLNVILRDKMNSQTVLLVSPSMLSSALVLLKLRVTRNKANTVLWVQDLYEQGLKETANAGGLSTRLIAFIENWLLGSVDQIVFAHEAFESSKKASLRSETDLTTISNWSQFSFRPSASPEATRENYGLSNSKMVLHIGNMGVKQGLENVVASARLAEESNSPVQFVLVGAGNQIEKLKSLAGKCKNITFIPPVSEDELSNLLTTADILLVNEKPGVKEMSMPSKLTTYYQTGTPILVCSERDSIAAQQIMNNDIGFWVQSGRPGDLLEAVLNLDLKNAKETASKARNYAERNLSKSKALELFAILLDKQK